MKKNLVFIDTETTGINSEYHEIIEIGFILTTDNPNHVLHKYNMKFAPKLLDRISSDSIKVNGYTKSRWENATIQKKEIWDNILRIWSGSIPVCHNPTFDRSFITSALLKFEIMDTQLDYHWLGTESLFWPIFLNTRMKKLCLDDIAVFFNLEPEGKPHQALNGANLCRKVYIKILEYYNVRLLNNAN